MPDYAPYNPVTISGSNWQAGEVITIVIKETDGPDPDVTYTLVADLDGNFTSKDFKTDSQDVGVHFLVTATGHSSRYSTQTRFSDGFTATTRVTGNWNENSTWSITRTGSITSSTASATVTGVSTNFLTELAPGDVITRTNDAQPIGTVLSIASNTSLTSLHVTETDAAGNPDPTPAIFSWVIDNTPPDTSIINGPTDASTTTNTTATFEFTGTDDVIDPANVVTFECRLDSSDPADFAACTSPKEYTGLNRTSHTFEVRAVDKAGNKDASPATRTWTITQIAPVITWNNPADITYPTALSATQLNATADVPGTFVYRPAAGTVLNAGAGQTLSVTFTPDDTANYSTVSKSVSINVLKATPVITWGNPADITYPAALGAAQLNATADVAGSFVYSPAAGTVLNAGAGQSLSVPFTPADAANYGSASKTVSINVLKASQAISVTLAAPTSAAYQSSFSVAATGGASGQPVMIAASGVCTGSGNNAAIITMTSGTGACTVTYNQAGDSNYSAAAPVSSSTLAERASQTISVTTPAPATATFNTSFGVAASASSGLPVAITTSGVCTGGGSGGSATVTVNSGTGSCTVSYNQAGDGNYSAATTVTETTAAALASTTTTIITVSPDPSESGTSYTVSVSVSGPGGTPSGQVAVSDGITSCLISAPAGSCSLTSSGPVTLTATYDGDANFNGSSVTRLHQVVDTAPTVAANNATVAVDEGQTAANTGPFADPTPTEDITIGASVGLVTKNGTNSGTWSWSYATSDGPAQSGTVTITVSDGVTPPVSTMFALVVNNVAPTVEIVGAPASSPEGQAIALDSLASDPSVPDSAEGYSYAWSVTKNGSAYAAGSEASFSFTPDDNGTYVVTLTATDKDGGIGTAVQTIAVSNVAPTITGIGIGDANSVDEGAAATLGVAFKDPGVLDSHTAVVDWGDGSPAETINLAAGVTLFKDHTYVDNADITINVTISDKDGGQVVGNLQVGVKDVGPATTTLYVIPSGGNVNDTVHENQSLTLTGFFKDPGVSDTHTVDVDWGDGSAAHSTLNLAGGVLTFTADHTYADNGSFTIGVTVTDKDGLSGPGSLSVQVVDVAPTVAITGAPTSSPEGTAITLGSTATDPSATDTALGFSYMWNVSQERQPVHVGRTDARAQQLQLHAG